MQVQDRIVLEAWERVQVLAARTQMDPSFFPSKRHSMFACVWVCGCFSGRNQGAQKMSHFPTPTSDKFVYSLDALPSTVISSTVDRTEEEQRWQQSLLSISRQHKAWLRKEGEKTHHAMPFSVFPVTSGEFSMLMIRRSV
jgi:hypothetical protein